MLSVDGNFTRPCPYCLGAHYQPIFKGYGSDNIGQTYQLVSCAKCRLVWIDPQPNSEELEPFYSNDYYGNEQKKFNPILESLLRLGVITKVRKLQKLTKVSHPKVLDIGCGRGLFLKEYHKLGADCYGVDIADFSYLAAQGIHFYKGDLEDSPAHFNHFDAVNIWHVLEHLPNPVNTLHSVFKRMKSGATLAVSVPNFSSWQARLFGPHWFHLDLPRHIFHFSKENLIRYLNGAGFQVISVETYSIEQGVFSFIQSYLNALYPPWANDFYRLLKSTAARKKEYLRLFFYLPVATLLFPWALIECFLSSLVGEGSVVTIYSKKVDDA